MKRMTKYLKAPTKRKQDANVWWLSGSHIF